MNSVRFRFGTVFVAQSGAASHDGSNDVALGKGVWSLLRLALAPFIHFFILYWSINGVTTSSQLDFSCWLHCLMLSWSAAFPLSMVNVKRLVHLHFEGLHCITEFGRSSEAVRACRPVVAVQRNRLNAVDFDRPNAVKIIFLTGVCVGYGFMCEALVKQF